MTHVVNSIVNQWAILSKQELRRKKIRFLRDDVGCKNVEELLGTFNNVNLYIDGSFNAGVRYGGPYGPRFIFDESLIYSEDSFLLKHDQSAFYNVPWNFPAQKLFDKRSKKNLILDYLKGASEMLPELHVPKKVSLKDLKAIIVYEPHLEHYSWAQKMVDVRIITIPEKNPNRICSVIPQGMDYATAFKSLQN